MNLKDNNGNNNCNPGSADKVKSRKTIVAIILVLAIIVGVILGINYFKTVGGTDSNKDGKDDGSGSVIVPGQFGFSLQCFLSPQAS